MKQFFVVTTCIVITVAGFNLKLHYGLLFVGIYIFLYDNVFPQYTSYVSSRLKSSITLYCVTRLGYFGAREVSFYLMLTLERKNNDDE